MAIRAGAWRKNPARTIKSLAVLPLALLLCGCGHLERWYYCGYGHQSVKNQDFTGAIGLLDECLELDTLDPQQRAFYLQTRGWAHFSLEDFRAALEDQEASFRIVAPSTRREFVNHAVYLRMAGRALESLAPLREAAVLDAREGGTSMMTQYNLGWSLHEVGRFEEAVAAYSKGLASQPDYPFAYFRRGLAYDRLGRVTEAREDFDLFVSILYGENARFKESFVAELRQAARSYPDLEALLPESN